MLPFAPHAARVRAIECEQTVRKESIAFLVDRFLTQIRSHIHHAITAELNH